MTDALIIIIALLYPVAIQPGLCCCPVFFFRGFLINGFFLSDNASDVKKVNKNKEELFIIDLLPNDLRLNEEMKVI